jgi:hypothetical protein
MMAGFFEPQSVGFAGDISHWIVVPLIIEACGQPSTRSH